MEFDLDESQEGEWFSFFSSHIDIETGKIVYDDPVSDARVRIRNPKPFIEERLAKRKKSVEHIFNPRTRSMERIVYFQDQTTEEIKLEREDLQDFTITGLENFKDKKTGQVILCTRENKIKLMRNSVFDRFVGRVWQLLDEAALSQKESEQKNSSPGYDG